MPMHDWTAVPDGIYHAFHHAWVSSICDRLNSSDLPPDLYALPEQATTDFSPTTRFAAETGAEHYRRKKSAIAIHNLMVSRSSLVDNLTRGDGSRLQDRSLTKSRSIDHQQ